MTTAQTILQEYFKYTDVRSGKFYWISASKFEEALLIINRKIVERKPKVEPIFAYEYIQYTFKDGSSLCKKFEDDMPCASRHCGPLYRVWIEK